MFFLFEGITVRYPLSLSSDCSRLGFIVRERHLGCIILKLALSLSLSLGTLFCGECRCYVSCIHQNDRNYRHQGIV